jgi:hypothetical protein
LNEALAQYDVAIERFPSNGVVARGRAYILILKKDYAAARRALTRSHAPLSLDDWVAEQMLAIADLSENNLDAAIAKLNHGAAQCPFVAQRKYYLSALAVARLRKSRQSEQELAMAESAIEQLKPSMTLPDEKGVVLLLSAHVAAAKRNRPIAEQCIVEARTVISFNEFARKRRELDQKLVSRFQLFEAAPRPLPQLEVNRLDDEIFEAEVQLLVA